jgi:UPF0716 protein FxsA
VGLWLFLIFVGVPILEIALFIKVGGLIGVLPTLGLCILSAMAGVALMRRQGLQALERLRTSVEAGGDPVGPIAHGALILVAGMLLVLPGFFTDAVGLLLLVPPVRRWVIARGGSQVTVRAAGVVRPRRTASAGGPEVIEAEYQVVEDAGPRRRGTSGWTTRPEL